MKKEALHPSYKSVAVIGTTVQSLLFGKRVIIYVPVFLMKTDRPCLVSHKKFYTSITSIFGHMHSILNVDKKSVFTV